MKYIPPHVWEPGEKLYYIGMVGLAIVLIVVGIWALYMGGEL